MLVTGANGWVGGHVAQAMIDAGYSVTNPPLSTHNPQQSTMNDQPWTLHPEPWTLNPEP